MRHPGLPEQFTLLGVGDDGREYIQCTLTGDVLVQTDDAGWSQFASGDEWRSRTAPQLYPQLVHLQRALKEVGRQEEVEAQVATLEGAIASLRELEEVLRERIRQLHEDAVGAAAG